MRSKAELTAELVKREDVPQEERKSALESAIFQVTRDNRFLGSTLQVLTIQYTHALPTAGVMFNNDLKQWQMIINPHYFCRKLNHETRQGVLLHEILHVLHKHPLRIAFTAMPERKRQIMNVAMDMVINQYIKHLPKGCDQCPSPEKRQPCANDMCPGRAIFLEDFYDVSDCGNNKIPWEANLAAEQYYEKLLTKFEEPEEEQDGDGDGQGQGGCSNQGNAGGGAQHPDVPDTTDVHHWDGSGEEKDQLEATEDLVKRAMVKSNYGYDKLPGFIRETLDYIERRKAELDYKKLILLAMRASLPANHRVHSWTRKSRRFGFKAPGTRSGQQPHLYNFIDTSGSISIEEANDFLGIVDEFLKVGANKCTLNLFHTDNYYSEEYKLGQRLSYEDFQSGGTCLEQSLRVVAEKRPDLAIFLTDGYYCDVDVESMIGPNDKFPVCLFIISSNGTEDHPLKRLGKTIKIPSSDGRN